MYLYCTLYLVSYTIWNLTDELGRHLWSPLLQEDDSTVTLPAHPCFHPNGAQLVSLTPSAL